LASGGGDGRIILWDSATHQQLGPPLSGQGGGGWYSLAFSPDGQILASGGGDGLIILWDAATRQPLGLPLSGHGIYKTDPTVGDLAFSPDGQTLASASWDTTIVLWDVATGQPLGPPLLGHTSGLNDLAFSPDGRTLASGGQDSTIRLWDVDLESWQARACRRANRNLTRAEWRQFFGDQPYRPTCPDLPLPPESG
jgi:WD40 repeat protein